MNVNTPAYMVYPNRFCARVGTKAKIDGNVIVGSWKSQMFYGLRGGRLLVAEFLNWPTENTDILRFIRKFGPLYNSHAAPEFKVTRLLWSQWKDHFRKLWEDLIEEPSAFEFEFRAINDVLRYNSRQLEFEVDYLATFLDLELASIDRRRLRKCSAPQCGTPYFVARHLKQAYCNEKCAEWAQAEWKRKWWMENGKQWRKQQRCKSSLSNHSASATAGRFLFKQKS